MSKSVEFVTLPSGKIQLVLLERDSYFRLKKRRTFTVSAFDLRYELKRAGLFETVEAEVPVADSIAAEARLSNEIAWYAAQKGQVGGTPDAKEIRNRLWSRINSRLGLR